MGSWFKTTRRQRAGSKFLLFVEQSQHTSQRYISPEKNFSLDAMARPKVSNDIPTMSDTDKDKHFTCPYNKYHRITALRYPSHVAGCRKVSCEVSTICSNHFILHDFVTVSFNRHNKFGKNNNISCTLRLNYVFSTGFCVSV
jgi:hypothetical protein